MARGEALEDCYVQGLLQGSSIAISRAKRGYHRESGEGLTHHQVQIWREVPEAVIDAGVRHFQMTLVSAVIGSGN